MRFQTRYDTWLVVVLVAIGLVLLGVPAAVYSQGEPIWLFLIGPVVYAFALLAAVPQYYEVREEGLFIRQGWRKVLLPYSELCQLSSLTSWLSAPVLSTHRLLVTAAHGGQHLIAVADEQQFLAEVAQHAPQLEQSGAGLRTSG